MAPCSGIHFLSISYHFSTNRTKGIVDTCLVSALITVISIVAVQSIAENAFADTNSAAIAYRSNTGADGLTSAKYREWNPSTLTWGAAVELPSDPSTSNIRFAWLEFSPISSKRVLVTLQDDGTLDSYVCATSCTTTTNWMIQRDFADLWAVAPGGSNRPFDIEFEKTSGNLMIVYDRVSPNSAQDLFYRTMLSGDAYFGTEDTIDDTTSLAADAVYSFVRMDSQKTVNANEITMIALGQTSQDAIAWVWSGSAWANQHELTAIVGTGTAEAIGVGYETNSGDAIIVAGEGTAMRYNQFSGGGWGVSATFGTIAIGQVDFVTVKSDPVATSNAIFVAEVGESNDIDSQYWSGSAWTDHSEHDNGVNGHVSRVLDFAWDNTGSRGVLIWATTSGQLDFKRFSGTNTFSARSSFAETSTHPWVQLSDIPNPTVADTVSSLGATLDATFDLGGIRWNGAFSNPVSTGDGGITSDTTVTTFENFKVAWQRSTAAPSWIKEPGEGLGLTDGEGKTPNKKISENLALRDGFQSVALFLRQLNEALALSDGRTFSASRRIDENLGLSDSKLSSSSKSFSENIGLLDTKSVTAAFAKTLSENLSSADQLVKGTSKTAVENVGLSENILTGRNFNTALSENVAAVDQLFKEPEIFVRANLGLGDSITTATDFVRVFTEDIDMADVTYTSTYLVLLIDHVATQLSTTWDISKNLNEALSSTDALDPVRIFTKSFAENLDAADGVANEVGKSMSENLTLAVNTIMGIKKTFSESAAFVDGLAKQISGTITENIEFGDSYAISKGISAFISENLALSDISSAASSLALSFVENIAMVDSFDVLDLVLTETIEVADGISDIVMDLELVLTESLAMTISYFTPQVAYQNSLILEDLQVSDRVEFGGLYNTTLNENIGISDSESTEIENFADNGNPEGEDSGQHGGNRKGYLHKASENLMVSDSIFVSRSTKVFVEDNLAMNDEIGPENDWVVDALADDKLIVKISLVPSTASSAFRIVPQAIASATFEITNNASSPQHIVLSYWYIDQQGRKIFEDKAELDLQPYESGLQQADIPFDSAGKYTLVVNLESSDAENMYGRTTSIDVTVPWLLVFLSSFLIMQALLTAIILECHYWNILMTRKYRARMRGDP
jgi:hypothetical protein